MELNFSIFINRGFDDIYVNWMKNFIEYVEQKYELPHVILWDSCVLEELAEYSAYISEEDEFTIAKLSFKDEQLATLFFLKFS